MRNGTAYPKSGMVVKIDFTSSSGKDAEKTELSIMLHDVVMEKDNTIPRSGSGSVAAERFRLRYKKMTYANMPPSSPDASLSVKLALMRIGDATASRSGHGGGMNFTFMDGSVKILQDGSVRFVQTGIDR
jgi:prepilin-type processing-associated H-X9-DG protein